MGFLTNFDWTTGRKPQKCGFVFCVTFLIKPLKCFSEHDKGSCYSNTITFHLFKKGMLASFSGYIILL